MTDDDMLALSMWQALNASSAAATTLPLSATADMSAADLTTFMECCVYAEMQPENKVTLLRLL
jgi:hypothetical protein